MRGNVRAIDILLDPSFALPGAIYLDAQYYGLFLDWLRADPQRVQALATRNARLVMFTKQLHEIFNPNSDRNRELRRLGIELPQTGILQEHKMFLAEALRTYFHDDPNARPQALLYTLARRHSGINRQLSILSQHRGFRRIPMVDTYFVPGKPADGPDGLPAQFDFFEDLQIHSGIRRAAAKRMQNGDTALALQQSVQNVYDRMRQLTGSTLDGRDLISYCLSQQAWEDRNQHRLVGTTPRLQVNPLSDSWEEREQLGLRDIGLGIQRIVRNPLAHKPVTDGYITNRFSEEREVLKLLCVLSYFIERIEFPKP
jgi:uncharacterized protein (TIGR02391 family)